MFEKLNEKDKKTATMGGMAILAFLVLFIVYQGYNTRESKDREYRSIKSNLNILNMSESQYKSLLNAVPIFQMPADEEQQKTNFRNSLDLLFERLQITSDPWVTVVSSKLKPPPGYGVLCLKTSTNRECRFQTILNLLAALKQNPYLAGIEEFKITCNEDNPQMANFSIILSTFTNNKRGQ